MELLEAIKSRRSIRRYKPDEVPRDVLEQLLLDAQWAPSNMNKQAWSLVAVRGEQRDQLVAIIKESVRYIRAKLDEEFKDKPKVVEFTVRFFENVGGAPVIVLVYIPEPGRPDVSEVKQSAYNFEHLTNVSSASAVVYNLTLLAHARGLATCWMAGPTYLAQRINEFLGTSHRELVAAVALGYPDHTPPVPPRKGHKIEWVGF